MRRLPRDTGQRRFRRAAAAAHGAAVALLGLLLAGATVAKEAPLPAFYRVVGVAPDDVLNVRAAPSAAAERRGKLAPDADRVAVVARSADAEWGLVNIGGRHGWASMHYLRRRKGQLQSPLARPLACAGTEPFWSLTQDAHGGLRFASLGGRTTELQHDFAGRSRNDTRAFGFRAKGPGRRATGVLRRARCSDGMSDRAYGLRLDLILSGAAAGTAHYTGCCALAD